MSPVSVRTKLHIQWLWQHRTLWDEPLDQDLLEDWTTILTDICKSADTSIQQRFFTTNFTEPGMQLHVFADASIKAYGAVVFFSRSDQTTLVMAIQTCHPTEANNITKTQADGCCYSLQIYQICD